MENMTAINATPFVNKYMSCIPRDLFNFLCIHRGERVSISTEVFNGIMARWEEQKAWEKALNTACSLNNKGIAYEKEGNIKRAIACYEKNILPETYLTMQPYNRLCVLYRKAKDYENEIRVISVAVERYSDNEEIKGKFVKRLEKAKTLLLKQKS